MVAINCAIIQMEATHAIVIKATLLIQTTIHAMVRYNDFTEQFLRSVMSIQVILSAELLTSIHANLIGAANISTARLNGHQ